MNKKERNEKGFTMVELIIVVAIMGIIGALLVPAFGTMSTKARLTTDIATVKTLKRTADSYKAEKGEWPTGTDLDSLNTTLFTQGYLEAKASLQTKDAKILISDATIKLDLTNVFASTSKGAVQKALDQIDSQIATDWVTGMTPATSSTPSTT